MNQAVVVNVETLQEAPTRAEDAPPPVDLPDINREIVKTREERTTARAETEKANINVNVAVRDQFIYGELCKTMPCQWMQKSENEQAILVMEQVRRASRENNRSASLGPHATLTHESAARSPTLLRAGSDQPALHSGELPRQIDREAPSRARQEGARRHPSED